jgi:hypothetical protein
MAREKQQAQKHYLPLNGHRDFYGGRCSSCNEYTSDGIALESEEGNIEYLCRSCRQVQLREANRRHWRRKYE